MVGAASFPILESSEALEKGAPMNEKVRNLWRFHCRRMAICPGDKSKFCLMLAAPVTTEKAAVALIRKRFTAEWWEGVLIQDVEEAGRLHMIDETPLYE